MGSEGRVLVLHPPNRLVWHDRSFACAIGAGGVRAHKREGDGATPAGRFPLRRVLYRADRLPAPRTALPLAPLAPRDGWCDDPADPLYNRPVCRPYGARHEMLWREDGVYDIVVILGYNDDPPVPHRGSAVFLHLARPDYASTAGCVAVSLPDMLAILARAAPGTALHIPGG